MIIQNTPTQKIQNYSALNFQARNKALTNCIQKAPTNLNNIGIGVASIIGGLLAVKQIEEQNSFKKCMELKNSNDFETYKKHLLNFLKQNRYKEGFIDDIQAVENSDELRTDFYIFIDNTLGDDDLLNNEELDIFNKIKKNEYSPELDNLIQKSLIKKADQVMPIAKLFSETDTDPEILEIKKELNTKYKQNNLFFNNDIDFAESCLEAFEILDKNDIPFNGTIISIDYLSAAGISLPSSNGPCIIINPNNWQLDEGSITKVILHEILHSLQPQSLEFNTQPIPEKFKETIAKISSYAEDNYAHEVHCELYVKKLTRGLSREEEELFNYLGGTFISKL